MLNKIHAPCASPSEEIFDFKEYIVGEPDNVFHQYLTAPIINNNKVYGVIIFSYSVSDQTSELGLISLNILFK